MFSDYLEQFIKIYFGYAASNVLISFIGIFILFLTSFLIQKILQFFARRYLKTLVNKTKTRFDDILYEKKVFSKGISLIPFLVLYISIPIMFASSQALSLILLKVVKIIITFKIVRTILSFVGAVGEFYKNLPNLNSPIKSYTQMLSLLVTLGGVFIAISIMLDKSPIYLLSGLGALTAVLLVIFKDALLGFVASIQLAVNDMVRIGDWIECPKHHADGEVIDITLTTVKVRNWDKTLSLVPAYALVSESFRNWRTMSESGGRRIKRSIPIDLHSIKKFSVNDLEKYKNVKLLKDYLETKLSEIDTYNSQNNLLENIELDGRQLTNLGLFRAYVEQYLKRESRVRDDFTFMVRQLAPSSQGIPIEVYVFTATTEWVKYEQIQSDIFDHLLSILRFFELRAFQFSHYDDLVSN